MATSESIYINYCHSFGVHLLNVGHNINQDNSLVWMLIPLEIMMHIYSTQVPNYYYMAALLTL